MTSTIINHPKISVDSYQGFYKKLEEILDIMAPYRK